MTSWWYGLECVAEDDPDLRPPLTNRCSCDTRELWRSRGRTSAGGEDVESRALCRRLKVLDDPDIDDADPDGQVQSSIVFALDLFADGSRTVAAIT